MIELEGIVSKMRYNYGKKEYLVTDGKSEYAVRSDELIHGSCIKIEGETDVNGALVVKKISIVSGAQEQKILETVKLNIRNSLKIGEEPFLVKDELTTKLWPQLQEVAIELTMATKLGRSVLLRFHGDADGVCGAFALTSIMYCKAFQQNSAIYTIKDAFRDMSTIGQENKPLIILLDFGSSDGCKEALDLISAAGIDYMIIDHHPYNNRENKKIINPFSISDGASKYTAGYLACEIAIACGLDVEKARELAKTACSGDKSDILKSDESDAKKAMVLDFLTNHVSFGNNLDFYKKVMDKPELFASISQQADESIEDAANKALLAAKRTSEKDVEICSFPLEMIVKKGEWPSSSKITTRVYDKLRADSPETAVVCIGYTERSIILRMNDEALGRGLSANGLAENVKRSMGDFVRGGGGHAKAGAIMVRLGFTKDVLGELMREITRMIN